MPWLRRLIPDSLAVLVLFVLPLLVFWPQTLGGRTLIPTDNLYLTEPYRTYREVVNAPPTPHNALLSDLVLQNYPWKAFIRDQLSQGEIPLWNPHQFSGLPFLAAGQHSALYPLSALFYIMPLTAAYGWFIVANLGLAGALMFALVRGGLGLSRAGALLAGTVYQLSGFVLASVVHPMMIAGIAWLPLLLLVTLAIVQGRRFLGADTALPWVALGAVALALNILAGHVEITVYTLLITAYVAAGCLLWLTWRVARQAEKRDLRVLLPALRRGSWLLVMVGLGFGLAALQFIPLLEFVQTNWRAERSDFDTVLSYAHPMRDLVQFVMPNFYGSPAHHGYLDVFSGQWVSEFTNLYGQPIEVIDWGEKNYVEAALYVGILPLMLALVALWPSHLWRNGPHPPAPPLPNGPTALGEGGTQKPLSLGRGVWGEGLKALPPYRLIFATLGALALSFMFGLPTYALIYVLPGMNQLNTPFRWVFALTVCVAVLAAFGWDRLLRQRQTATPSRWPRRLGLSVMALGGLVLLSVPALILAFPALESLINRLLTSLAHADRAFSDARMFVSYQVGHLLHWGGMLVASGALIALSTWRYVPPATEKSAPAPDTTPPPSATGISEDYLMRPSSQTAQREATPDIVLLWRRVRSMAGRQLERVGMTRALGVAAVLLVALDLALATGDFNPAADPLLLDFQPPAVQFLLDREAEESPFRYTTLEDQSVGTSILSANATLRYGLDDLRGYDSIIPADTVAMMRALAPQGQLIYNRVAPLFIQDGAPHKPLLDLFNVRYVVAHNTITLAGPDWTRVHQDPAVSIWRNENAVPRAYTVPAADFEPVWLNDPANLDALRVPDNLTAASITRDTGREKFVNVSVDEAAWLIVSEMHMAGWRAFVRPAGAGEADERALEVQRVLGNFQGVYLSEPGAYTLRLIYSPASFQVGAFASVVSVAVLVFLLGVWFWRAYVGVNTEASSQMARLARNSLAPIILNLFNRGIDFALAMVILRLLTPEAVGVYYFAIVIFVWFDIFTNFGLDVFVIREVARNRERAGTIFYNTSLLRIGLSVLGVVLLAGFLALYQSNVPQPINAEGLTALFLLYLGLFPASLSKGMTALFYAHERAEIPAAVATLTTINKAVFQVIALVLGYGIVGLAAVSIGVNLLTLAILIVSGQALIGKIASFRPDARLMRGMVGESWPLMLNNFLATIFFQIDVVILQALRGEAIVARYSIGYRWLLALNIIPAFFTQALMPLLSRQAQEDRQALRETYVLGLKVLYTLALPIAVGITFLAEFLTLLLGGPTYMPDGAIALTLMIWSIPIGWLNSLTQYLLIAVDRQRLITRAFFLAVSFNIITNLMFIPQYGYQAAAVMTILSELVLFVPFMWLTQRDLGRIDWLDLLWRQALAAGLMALLILTAWDVAPLFGLMAGSVLYGVVLWRLRPLSDAELERFLPLLPSRLRESAFVGALRRSNDPHR